MGGSNPKKAANQVSYTIEFPREIKENQPNRTSHLEEQSALLRWLGYLRCDHGRQMYLI